MSSTVTVTVRCAGCARILASYYGIPRGGEARTRLGTAASELLDWHRQLHPTCKGGGTRFAERAEPR
jgi:hypothetical protein